MRRLPYIVLGGLLLVAAGCDEKKSEEQLAALVVEEVAAYWAVRGTAADGTTFIRPVVRFKVRNGGTADVGHIQAMAVFKRESFPDEPWGNAFLYSITETPIAVGETSDLLTMRCDSNFVSKDSPEQMFDNPNWEDVAIEVFLRVGPSSWRSALVTDVPKHIGAPGLEKFISPENP